MSGVAILTDSTAYIPPNLIARYNIQVIPLKIHWKGETFLDGVNLTPSAFYERQEHEAEIPTTSQPSIEEFLQIFEALASHHDGIVTPLISSGISGTVDTARAAAMQFTSAPIEIIDSLSTSGGLALVVLAAAEAAEAGKSLEEVIKIAQTATRDLNLFAMVDTLKYLHRGGRIGGIARYFGSALNIKPIVYFDQQGKLDALERVRTRSKALDRLVELAAKKSGGALSQAGVFHADAPEAAELLKAKLAECLACGEILTFELSPVIGIHVGPGVVGVAFIAGMDS